MKESAINIRVIEPQEGYYLTQAFRNETEEVILSKKVYLPINGKVEDWVEISEVEGEQLSAEVRARLFSEINR